MGYKFRRGGVECTAPDLSAERLDYLHRVERLALDELARAVEKDDTDLTRVLVFVLSSSHDISPQGRAEDLLNADYLPRED